MDITRRSLGIGLEAFIVKVARDIILCSLAGKEKENIVYFEAIIQCCWWEGLCGS